LDAERRRDRERNEDGHGDVGEAQRNEPDPLDAERDRGQFARPRDLVGTLARDVIGLADGHHRLPFVVPVLFFPTAARRSNPSNIWRLSRPPHGRLIRAIMRVASAGVAASASARNLSAARAAGRSWQRRSQSASRGVAARSMSMARLITAATLRSAT